MLTEVTAGEMETERVRQFTHARADLDQEAKSIELHTGRVPDELDEPTPECIQQPVIGRRWLRSGERSSGPLREHF